MRCNQKGTYARVNSQHEKNNASSAVHKKIHVYIGYLLCHILLIVVPFGTAVSKKIVTVCRDHTRGPLDTCLMTSEMDMIEYVLR